MHCRIVFVWIKLSFHKLVLGQTVGVVYNTIIYYIRFADQPSYGRFCRTTIKLGFSMIDCLLNDCLWCRRPPSAALKTGQSIRRTFIGFFSRYSLMAMSLWSSVDDAKVGCWHNGAVSVLFVEEVNLDLSLCWWIIFDFELCINIEKMIKMLLKRFV